jgi:hypothetical protein
VDPDRGQEGQASLGGAAVEKKDQKTRRGGFRFFSLRERYKKKQKELQTQFQAEVRRAGQDDAVMVTRLKLIYRKRGLNI